MKYIIVYLSWCLIEVPCPQQAEYDKIHGVGRYSCSVFHGMWDKKRVDTTFYNRDSAYKFANAVRFGNTTDTWAFGLKDSLLSIDSAKTIK
jgi:hypothetical protein